jgi:hypothetical protein
VERYLASALCKFERGFRQPQRHPWWRFRRAP